MVMVGERERDLDRIRESPPTSRATDPINLSSYSYVAKTKWIAVHTELPMNNDDDHNFSGRSSGS